MALPEKLKQNIELEKMQNILKEYGIILTELTDSNSFKPYNVVEKEFMECRDKIDDLEVSLDLIRTLNTFLSQIWINIVAKYNNINRYLHGLNVELVTSEYYKILNQLIDLGKVVPVDASEFDANDLYEHLLRLKYNYYTCTEEEQMRIDDEIERLKSPKESIDTDEGRIEVEGRRIL